MARTKTKVGFFGGTFDPIHFGHLNLALSILEANQLKQVFFSPANYSPEKKKNPPIAPKEARKEMIELAIEDIPEFTVIEDEIEREGPSYTIDTIRALEKRHPHMQFHLILGKDVLDRLAEWKEVEELLALAPPLIGARPGNHLPSLPTDLKKKIKAGETPIPTMEISATEIRQRLREGKYCGHLLPAKVIDYIKQHRLYY